MTVRRRNQNDDGDPLEDDLDDERTDDNDSDSGEVQEESDSDDTDGDSSDDGDADDGSSRPDNSSGGGISGDLFDPAREIARLEGAFSNEIRNMKSEIQQGFTKLGESINASKDTITGNGGNGGGGGSPSSGGHSSNRKRGWASKLFW